jgi:peptidoglycan hydrolase-like protein with peptidoglycan-binding domain
MTDTDLIQTLIDDGTVGRTLKMASDAKPQIKVLQEMLYHLGFGKALTWDKFGPDGNYGKSTAKAVAAFAKANGVTSDGSNVSANLARLLIQRYAFLDEMHHMHDAVNNNALLRQLTFKSSAKVAITVLQSILHELGYDEEMNWQEFGADGEYGNGTARAVKAFAEKNGIKSDGKSVTKDMAEASLKGFVGSYGPDCYKESPKLVRESLKITETNKKITVSDGATSKTFSKFRKGYYTGGNAKTAAFIDANRADLKKQGMSDSALNVMLGVSENEGNLDAINTWDNAFMTFGMFQWTIGAGSAKGELPALFKKIRDRAPDVWQIHYGQYGLDIWPKTSDVSGHLILNGQIINADAEKEQFRTPKWGFYFWKAGQDPIVQAISLQHAFLRIGTFARSPSYQVNGHDVADIVTSEYGMALVLDNHVNRPAYIAGCLAGAMKRAGLQGSNPSGWGTVEEPKLLQHYLVIRQTYGKHPMTNAKKRGEVTKKYLTKGIISDKRGSFRL